MQTIRQLLRAAAARLHHSTTPRLDAELLLAYVLGWSRTRLLAEATTVLDVGQCARFAALLERRAQGEPVAYLIGQREFYGLPLYTDARVLIPRPETELVVELALPAIVQRIHPAHPVRVVDVGTGSGAIILALAAHIPAAVPVELIEFYATDISSDALAVAAANRARHNLNRRVHLLHGDLLDPLPPALHGQIDVLVSNPPYTILSEIDAAVRAYEPHLALDGGSEGLDVYRRLLAQVPLWLHPQGMLALEIGAWQGAAVQALVQAALPQHQVQIHRDLARHERVVLATPARAAHLTD